MNISEKIYALRTKSGITQETLAEKLDVSRQSVQKWETGVNYLPTIDKLIAIAKMYCDVRVSHVKNGVYGSMWVAEMIAAAYVADDMKRIIQIGL